MRRAPQTREQISSHSRAHFPNSVRCMIIKASPIDGLGVFALRQFDASETIYSTSQIEVRTEPCLGTVERGINDHVLDPKILRWVNHSCAANAEIKFFKNAVALVAMRPIASGDEIVCDYRTTETIIPSPFQCRCGVCAGTWIGCKA